MDGPTLIESCRRWIRATWQPFLAYLGALIVLAAAARSQIRFVVVGVAVVLLAISVWFGHVIRRERRRATYQVGPARLTVAALLVVVSLVVIVLSRVSPSLEPVAFAALGTLVIAVGGGISEARANRKFEHVRGPVVLGVAALVLTGTLVFRPTSRLFLLLLAVGLVLADFGTELHSEDELRSRPVWHPGWIALLGAVVLALSVGLLHSAGAGLAGASLFVVVVAILVALAAMDSESLLVVLVIAVALLWASAPRGAEADARHEATVGQPYYLVLGDSYISGEGAERFYAGTNTSEQNETRTNTCRRAPTSWANLLASATNRPANVPDRVLFVACSGAVGANIRATPRTHPKGKDQGKPWGAAELVEFEAKRQELGNRPPAFVVISVGGNDAGFGTVGKTCIGPGSCAELGDGFLFDPPVDEEPARGLATVEAELDKTYADVRSAVGSEVPVIAIPYPVPVSDAPECPDVFLGQVERRFLVKFINELNETVRSAATRAGFLYMDTMAGALADAGMQLCDGPNAGLNFLDWHPQAGNVWQSLTPTNWTHNSIHPNEPGHEAMLAAALRWFEEHRDLKADPPSNAKPRDVAPITKLLDFGETTLCTARQKSGCSPNENDWLFGEGYRLVVSSFLPAVMALVGAWMIVMWPIRAATENNVSAATVFLWLWRRVVGHRPPGGPHR